MEKELQVMNRDELAKRYREFETQILVGMDEAFGNVMSDGLVPPPDEQMQKFMRMAYVHAVLGAVLLVRLSRCMSVDRRAKLQFTVFDDAEMIVDMDPRVTRQMFDFIEVPE